jgi:hypothetical protein
MSIVPGATGIVGSAAGTQLSQSSSASSERAGRDAATSDQTAANDRAAEAAAGIGQTQADQETSDRDADGRRLWETPAEAGSDEESQGEQKRPPRDPRGESGNALDLIG